MRKRLTYSQAEEVRGRYAAGETQTAIARDLGVTPQAISMICSGKSHGREPIRRNRQEPALNTIATVTGKLTLTIADSPAIDLGNIKIPISAKTNLRNDGELVLTATPNMRQVREFIEQVFLAADDINAIEEGRQ